MLRTHKEGGGDTRDFTDVLAPLKGQVRKAVGRRWDAFYSDLCKLLDRRSVQGAHVFEHLYDFCELEIQVIDGELWTKPAAFGSKIRRVKEDSFIEFYVDPRDGIIKKNKAHASYRTLRRLRAKREAVEALAVRRVLDESTELHKIEGTWFVCEFAMTPMGEWTTQGIINGAPAPVWHAKPVKDCLTNSIVSTSPPRSYRHIKTPAAPVRYCKSKRTASRKMLKQHGLVAE